MPIVEELLVAFISRARTTWSVCVTALIKDVRTLNCLAALASLLVWTSTYASSPAYPLTETLSPNVYTVNAGGSFTIRGSFADTVAASTLTYDREYLYGLTATSPHLGIVAGNIISSDNYNPPLAGAYFEDQINGGGYLGPIRLTPPLSPSVTNWRTFTVPAATPPGTYYYSYGITFSPGIGEIYATNLTVVVLGPVKETFSQYISNSWDLPIISGNQISDTFEPFLNGIPALSGSSSSLAALGGFDHFNIEQVITSISGNTTPTRPPGIDPLLGGNDPPYQNADLYDWYFNEYFVFSPLAPIPTYDDPSVLTSTSFTWGDAPNLTAINNGTTIQFTDYLVGVYSDHSGVRISDLYPDAKNVNFTWTFTQGPWGGSGYLQHFSAFGPPVPGSQGSVHLLGFFGNDPTQLSPTSFDASTLISNLLAAVTNIGPDRLLATTLNVAQAYWKAKDVPATCAMLDWFVDEVKWLGVKDTNPSFDTTLVTDAQAIQMRIGCKWDHASSRD